MPTSGPWFFQCTICSIITPSDRKPEFLHICPDCGTRGPWYGYPDLAADRMLEAIRYFDALGKKNLHNYVDTFNNANESNLGRRLTHTELREARSMVTTVMGGLSLDAVAFDELQRELPTKFRLKEGAIVGSFIFRLCLYNESQPEHSSVVLHAAALIEHMLWARMVAILMRQGEDRPKAESTATDESWGGFKKKTEYLGVLVGEKLKDVCGRLGHSAWLNDCIRTTKSRNAFLHDARVDIFVDDADLAVRVAEDSVTVMSDVWNDWIRRTRT